ncbi:MAG: tetratricopeptide repeat protein [Armatimonadota bacterium]|nr:tetratricopeptide repeat protein [Armatimonadota bacterium]
MDLRQFLSYPFPIAFVLKTNFLEAEAPYQKANELIRLSNTALQYAALIAASNYANSPFKDEKVSHRFKRLKRPLVSDFAYFLRESVPALKEKGRLFVPELHDTVRQLERKRVRALRMGEKGFEEKEMNLLEALINLRNALSHDRYRGRWEVFIEHHVPLVGRFLQLMDWCAKYPLIRLVGNGQMVRLMGSEPTFTTEPIPDAALDELARAQREGELTGLLLADPTLSRFLTLYPFILWSDCPYCEQETLLGLTEEVFLFNGDEGQKYVAYVGVVHSRPMSAPKQRLDEIYDEKDFPPEPISVSQLTYPILYERSSRQSEIWLHENIVARRYIPQVYHPRKEMESELEAFLKGSKTGFLLLGEAGIGKTNLLCRKVEEWRERGEIVLFYAGHQLPASSEGNVQLLKERIMQDLYLTGDFLELLNFLRKEGRRLIFVVDGVNEHSNPVALLKCLCNFAQSYFGKNLKVIFSFRSAFFDKALQALAEGKSEEQKRSLEAGLFPSSVFQVRMVEREGRKVETYRFTLERMEEKELEAIYEAYRAYEGRFDPVTGKWVRFRPTTPFASLTPSVRSMLTHPWYLRMVMEAYDGKPIPQRLWAGEVLKAFCDAKIYGRTHEERERFAARADLVDELVKLMRKNKTDTFRRDQMHELSPNWSRVLVEIEIARSPYLQLVDEGVLIEVPETEIVGRRTRTRYLIRFAFDSLFEYLLSEDILAEVGGWENLTGEHLAKLLYEGLKFDYLTGAVELLLIEAAQNGKFGLLSDTLNVASKPLAVPVFVQVLMTLEGMGHENFHPLVKHLAQNAQTDKALSVLLRASYEFGTKQRLRPFLFCSDMAREIALKAVNEGRVELANDLAGAIMNKGVALQSLGRISEAIGCYEEAIAIRRRLVEEEGRVELANDLAKAIMNKGLALKQLGEWQKALECYNEGIGWWERLVEAGMTHLVPDLIKGFTIRFDLHRWLGNWGEAAEDVKRVLIYVAPFLETPSPPELLMREFSFFLQTLRSLSDDEKAQLYATLGDDAEEVMELIEGE